MRNNMRYYAFSVQALTTLEQESLQAMFTCHIDFWPIAQLFKLTQRQLWETLRHRQLEKCIIILDDTLQHLIPVMQLLAAASSCKKIILIKNKEIQTLDTNKFIILISTGLKTLLATLRGLIALMKSYGLYCWHRHPKKTIYPQKIQNILFLNANLWYGVKAGGSVSHIAGVITALKNVGFKVTYAATEANPLLNNETLLLSSPPTMSFWRELNYYLFNTRVIKQLSAGIWPFQLIYQRLSLCNFAGVILARWHQVPLIIEYNSSEVWAACMWGKKLFFKKMAQRFEQFCLQQADMIITVSEVLQLELQQRGIPANKIVYYPNGVNTHQFNMSQFSTRFLQEQRTKYDIPNHATVIAFIGTFGIWHGIEILVAAIKELIDTHLVELSSPLHFLLIGDGNKLPWAKQSLSHARYQKYVTFTGLIQQSLAIPALAIADILVCPTLPNPDGSLFFGSPTKLFEYMALGKAIIASRLGQIASILQSSLSAQALPTEPCSSKSSAPGILCEPGHIPELVNAILFLATHPEWRTVLGKNAYEIVTKHYTWQHHVEHILQNLPHLLKRDTALCC